MRKLIILTIIIISGIFNTNNIWAQSKNISGFAAANYTGKKEFRPSVAKRTLQLKKELALDENQTAAVKLLLNDHFEKAAAIRSKNEGKENFIENLQLKAARMQFQRELKNMLDKEQRKKLDAFKDKRKAEKRLAQN